MSATEVPARLFVAVAVDCRFGATYAVRQASCAIGRGQHIAVTGPSGSGKSTLLHVVSGLHRPTAGAVAWPDLGGDPRTRLALIATIFQAPSLLEPLDVAENVELPLLLAGARLDAAREAALSALDAVGLVGLAARMPHALSGGQAQRIAVARALAMRPRLILADEPTGQLDHDTAAQVMTTLIRAAERTGAALVVATHDESLSAGFAQRWRMLDGHLDTRGTASEVER